MSSPTKDPDCKKVRRHCHEVLELLIAKGSSHGQGGAAKCIGFSGIVSGSVQRQR